MAGIEKAVLISGAVVLSILVLAALVRAILGPRFTDRIVAVNMINTMVVGIIATFSVLMGEDYLVDVALVYALLSFLTVVVLARTVIIRQRRKQKRRLEQTGGEEHGA